MKAFTFLATDQPRRIHFEVIKDQLSMYAKIIEQGLGKLGMQTRILSGLEALDLFYTFYNTEQAKLQPLKQQTMHMLAQQFI